MHARHVISGRGREEIKDRLHVGTSETSDELLCGTQPIGPGGLTRCLVRVFGTHACLPVLAFAQRSWSAASKEASATASDWQTPAGGFWSIRPIWRLMLMYSSVA